MIALRLGLAVLVLVIGFTGCGMFERWYLWYRVPGTREWRISTTAGTFYSADACGKQAMALGPDWQCLPDGMRPSP
jgi:hypothetical protein